jgi:hypothetical protein
MIGSVSHDMAEETPEKKAEWFQSLTMEERMEVFCSLTDLILAINPQIMEQKSAEPVPGRIQVLRAP